MASAAWETEHGVESETCLVFAWRYWTGVTNCDEPPAKLELEGSCLRLDPADLTRLPDQKSVHWSIRG
jgi:hypothetical protein